MIVLTEKAIPFERVYVDLAHPPQWFAKASPLGKVPLLQVGDDILFESAIICEYLDETVGERIHPTDPLQRAKHRAWMEFGSTILDSIWAFYTAPNAQTLETKASDLRNKFLQLEMELRNGPYFSGNRFSMVDAVFGPIFRYFDVFDEIADFRFFDDTPKVRAWREVSATRPSVKPRFSISPLLRPRNALNLREKRCKTICHRRVTTPPTVLHLFSPLFSTLCTLATRLMENLGLTKKSCRFRILIVRSRFQLPFLGLWGLSLQRNITLREGRAKSGAPLNF